MNNMIDPKNILNSTKKIGKNEDKLIKNLTKHFEKQDYYVVPHSRFNIAWGSIKSDLDILLIKHNVISYIEVKSKNDKIKKALIQIDKVKDIIDYGWIATEKTTVNVDSPNIGIIKINNDEINIIKHPIKFKNQPSFETLFSLKKKCLLNFLNKEEKRKKFIFKYDIAKYIYENKKHLCNRINIKHIVTCSNDCDNNCPIFNMLI